MTFSSVSHSQPAPRAGGLVISEKKIVVFYHLFLVNDWQEVFENHVKQLLDSGLYAACQEIYIGVVYKDSCNLVKLQRVLGLHNKLSLYYTREFDALGSVWETPRIQSRVQLGEAETILKMVEYAQQEDASVNYLFFHSKGVTNPDSQRRSQIDYFFGKGLSIYASREEANDFILRDMNKIIAKWKDYVQLLETKRLSYYIWNFFWVRGDLLHCFDFNKYMKMQRRIAPPRQQFRRLKSRHVFALFPVKLAFMEKNLKMGEMSEYIDFQM